MNTATIAPPKPAKIDANDVAAALGPDGLRAEVERLTGEAAPTAPSAEARGPLPAGWEPPIPFTQHEVPPFPTDIFPGWLRAFVEAEAETTQTPPDLAGLLALAALAATSAGKWALTVKLNWREPLPLFVCVVLPPANRTTTVFRDVTAPLTEWEREAARKAGPAIEAARNKAALLEKRLARLRETAAKEGPDGKAAAGESEAVAQELGLLRIPAAPRLICEDVTPEKLASLLAEQDGRLALLAPEGGIFDILKGRYSRDGKENFQVFLNGHAGDAIRVDRQGRGPVFIDHPALTVGLRVQPDILRGLARCASMRGRGLLARFLFAVPRSNLGTRNPDPEPMPPAVREIYRERLRALCDVEPEKDSDGRTVPRGLHLDAEAREAAIAFEAEREPRLGPGGDLARLGDWAGKLTGALCRVAALLHLAETAGRATTAEVPVATVKRALGLAPYLIAHARAAFEEMGADPAQEDAQAILDWLKARGLGRFTERDTYRQFRHLQDPEARQAALAALEDRVFIRAEVDPPEATPRRGRKGSRAYDVNPAVCRGES